MRKISIALSLALSSCSCAATTSVALPASVYTQVGSAATAAYITTFQSSSYCFSSTQPSASTTCHHLAAGEIVPVCSMAAGVKTWFKPDTNATTAVITQSTDAQIYCSSAGGSSDATAANQVTGNTSLSSIDSKTPALVSGRQPVDGSGVTQPVSASALPLPSGAATSANQSTQITALGTINTTLGSPLQAGGNVVVTSAPTTAVTNASLSNLDVALSTRLKPSDTLTAVTTVGTITNPVGVTGTFWQATQPVSAASLPLPSGAATSALQTTGNTALTTINTTLGSPLQAGGNVVVTSAPTTAVTQSGTWTVQPGNTANTTAWKIDGSGVTQPVSAASLPLPSGAATSALQTTGNTTLSAINTTLGSPLQAGGNVVVTSAPTTAVTGTFWQATQPVSAASLPLPSGAATSAIQATTNSTLSNMNTLTGDISSNTQSMDSRLASAVALLNVMTSDIDSINNNIPALTVTSSRLLVDGSGVTQPVSGTVTANAGTNLNTSLLAVESGGNLATIATNTALKSQGSTTSGQSGNLVMGAVTTAAPSYTTAQTSPVSLTTAGRLRIDGSGTTQPVSGTFWQTTQPISAASLPLPSGAATNSGITGTSSKTLSDVVASLGNTVLQEGGHVIVSSITLPSYYPKSITTSTTTVISSSPGAIHTVVIATRGVGSTFKCYDNASAASGTVVTGTIDTTLSTTSFLYDTRLINGLTCVSTGATPADLLVTYSDGT